MNDMKETIKKLFQGTKEDMIIACNLLVSNYNPHDFLKEWKKELKQTFLDVEKGKEPIVMFANSWDDSFGSFYYQYEDTRYLACNISRGVCITHQIYITVDIIKHF